MASSTKKHSSADNSGSPHKKARNDAELQVLLADTNTFADGSITDVNPAYEVDVDDIEEVYTITFTEVKIGVNAMKTYDDIIALYISIPTFRRDRTYLHEDANRAYIGFRDEAGYLRGKEIANPYGKIFCPSGYVPTDIQGMFWRLLITSTRMGVFTTALIVDLFTRLDAMVSSVTINIAKGCATVYFQDEKSWLKGMKGHVFPVTLGSETAPVAVTIHHTYAATSDPAWGKLFIANLPNSHVSVIRRLFAYKWGVYPEIFSLIASPKSGKVFNYGILLSKNAEIIDRLLRLSMSMRTIKGREVVIKIATRGNRVVKR